MIEYPSFEAYTKDKAFEEYKEFYLKKFNVSEEWYSKNIVELIIMDEEIVIDK